MNKFVVILLLGFIQQTFAQTLVEVKDTVLAGILCERFPEAMVNNCTQLDLSKEAFISDTIIISDTTIYDVSPLLELTETVWLELKNNQIDTIVGDFGKLVNLQILDLSWNENLSSFPDFETINSSSFHTLNMLNTMISDTLEISSLENSLVNLNVRGNYLTSIPDLTQFPNLVSVNLIANNLSFNDLIPFLSDTDTRYSLFHQRTFGLQPRAVVNREEGVPFEFTVDIDTLHPDNVYRWYKNKELFETTYVPVLNFSNLSLSDSGKYHLIITNPAFPALSDSLIIRDVTLNVSERPEDCKALETAGIELRTTCNAHELVYTGDDLDSLRYELRLESDTVFIENEGNVFLNLENGWYELKLSTPKCEFIYPETLFIKGKGDCDQVISPNGDGIGDTYYFKQEGEIKLMNKHGRILKTMHGPLMWDGQDDSGSLLDPGYYLILFENDQSINITVEY